MSTKRLILEAASPQSKQYERFEAIPLPQPTLPKTPLIDLLNKRRSTRTFDSTQSITKSELASLLFCTAGMSSKDEIARRTYPSGGGLQVVEHYVLVERVADMKPGLYHYHAPTHSCTHLPAAQHAPNELWEKYAPIENPAATIILTAVWNRAYPKYGEFSYRLALAEAGHSAQNALLTTTALSLGACPIMGFDEEKVRTLLDITHDDEDPLYLICTGHGK